MDSFILALQSSGLTIEQIIADIPRDAGALVAYAVLGAFFFMTWYGSRPETLERYAAARDDTAQVPLELDGESPGLVSADTAVTAGSEVRPGVRLRSEPALADAGTPDATHRRVSDPSDSSASTAGEALRPPTTSRTRSRTGAPRRVG